MHHTSGTDWMRQAVRTDDNVWKGDDPFQGWQARERPVLTDGKRQAYAEAGPPMRLRGCGPVFRGFARKCKTPGFAGGSLSK